MLITIIIVSIAVVVLLLLLGGIIKNLQKENSALCGRLYNLNLIVDQQRKEIDAMILRAQSDRRARQLEALTSQEALKKGATPMTKRSEVIRSGPAPASEWETAAPPYMPTIVPSPAPAAPYYGGGGTFDGGGASGDYGRSDSCSTSSSSSSDSPSSSDSGSSGSSDSGSSCSSD